MGYKTVTQQKDEDRRAALHWLFLADRGLLDEFTEFCRENKDMSLDEIDSKLRTITTKQNNNNG